MPLPISLARRRLLSVAVGATALLAAIPAVASASTGACTVSTTTGSPLFAAYGDPGDYILAPGGTFGSGAAGWSLTNAAVKTGAGIHLAGFASDTNALGLNNGAIAVGPAACINSDFPVFRFFARSTSSNDTVVSAKIIFTNASGIQATVQAGVFVTTPSWTTSAAYPLATALPAGLTATNSVKLEFTTESGTAQVDDIYFDPYSRT